MKKVNIQLFGLPNYPVYGEHDLGSLVEDAEKVIDKIKTNKFTLKEVLKLSNIANDIVEFVIKEKLDENKN